jgi:glycosyltransferase involved in cell wall biosynthesis
VRRQSAGISVVIPAYNAEDTLERCLGELYQPGATPPDECIVVDDGSTDGTAAVAKKYGAVVLSTGGRRGPAFARNLGARTAGHELLMFLDADVSPHVDTVERMKMAFSAEAAPDAVMGSYDDSPGTEDFLSQYRNLMHCFTHQISLREACTFWSGCGAIRKELFLEHGGFDEAFGRPAIEDIELGYRLKAAGKRLILDREIQVKHLKKWTFMGLLKTDIMDRGIPWTELILRDHRMPNDLNLQLSQRVSVVLSFLLLGTCAVASVALGDVFVVPMIGLLILALGRYWVDGVAPVGGAAIAAVMLSGISAYLWWRGMPALIAPMGAAYVLLFLRHRYWVGHRYWHLNTAMLAIAAVGGVWAMIRYMPDHGLIRLVVILLLLLVWLNNRFYVFLAAKRGGMFTVAAIPFHLLFHLYNGISFIAGILLYSWRKMPAAKHRLSSERPVE